MSSPPLITGDYYLGADGPTIILFPRSRDAVEWLASLFEEAKGSTTPRDLLNDPSVHITGLESLSLVGRASGPAIQVRKIGQGSKPSFEWSATKEGWETCSGLLEPFLRGKTGHQYFDYEGIHDATIEVSFGEDHPA